MKYLSNAYVYFSISGSNLDIQEFLDQFQIITTNIGKNRRNEQFIEYKIDAKDANEGLEETLQVLLKTISPNAKKMKLYASKRELYMKIFIVIHSKNNEDNGVFLNKNFIEFLNELGAEIEINTYNK